MSKGIVGRQKYLKIDDLSSIKFPNWAGGGGGGFVRATKAVSSGGAGAGIG